MTKKQALKLMKKYDREFSTAIGKIVEEGMSVSDVDDFSIRGNVMAKALCNNLVAHLGAFMGGDMDAVRDFIVTGINIDLETAYKLYPKR